MVSFENFVKSMTPSLLELKVTPSFCFPFKIPDDLIYNTHFILPCAQEWDPAAASVLLFVVADVTGL